MQCKIDLESDYFILNFSILSIPLDIELVKITSIFRRWIHGFQIEKERNKNLFTHKLQNTNQ